MSKVSLKVVPLLRAHKKAWASCTQCEIGKLAKYKVFFRGRLPCDVLFIGEGPGKSEDVIGQPFVGMAGKVFDNWVNEASSQIDFTWAVTNTVLCRPTDCVGGKNRAPNAVEVNNCSPRLEDFVQNIAKPKVIVCLGKVADESFSGNWSQAGLFLPHPAWILKQGGSAVEESLQAMRDLVAFLKEQI